MFRTLVFVFISIYLLPGTLWAVQGPYVAEVYGAEQLSDLVEGESTAVSLKLVTGRYNLILERIASSKVLPEQLLFIGSVRGRAYAKGINKVSASLYNGSLEISFHSRRKRVFLVQQQLNSSIGNSYARVKHRTPLHSYTCMASHSSGFSNSTTNTRALSKAKLIKVGVDVDREFYVAQGSSVKATKAKINSIFNTINALYLEQLGIGFDLVDIHIFKSSSQPYRSKEASGLIKEFMSYTLRHKHIAGDLKHLFTGKDTILLGSGNLIGAAFVGVACRAPDQSFGFTERTHPSVQALVVAHELAHNLGASHDVNTPSLMYPRASSANERFSDYSLAEINGYLGQYGTCAAEAAPKLNVALRIRAGGSLKFSSSISNMTTKGCALKLYAAAKKGVLKNSLGRAVKIKVNDISDSNFAAQLENSSVRNVPAGTIYVRGMLDCVDQQILSPITKLKVNPKAKRLKKVSVASFLKQL